MNKKLLEFKREEITLTEAANRYSDLVKGTWTFDTWAKGLEDEIKGITFYVYKDHIIIDYIDLNPEGSRVEGYIFEKGVTVEGSIYNEADDFGIAFISLGDVYAKNIYLGGGDFYVDGNIEVEEIAGGRYDHSYMRFCGKKYLSLQKKKPSKIPQFFLCSFLRFHLSHIIIKQNILVQFSENILGS